MEMRSLGNIAGVMEWWGQCLSSVAQKKTRGIKGESSRVTLFQAFCCKIEAETRLYLVGRWSKRGVFPSGKKSITFVGMI